jgi:hypothetical protein
VLNLVILADMGSNLYMIFVDYFSLNVNNLITDIGGNWAMMCMESWR